MTVLGPHLKITAHAAHRQPLRAILGEVFDLPLAGEGPAFDIYRIGAGSIGYFFVDAAEDALAPADARKGAWIEFLVDDPAAARAALAARGVEPFVYDDATHDYYALPGGQIVRLAGARAAS